MKPYTKYNSMADIMAYPSMEDYIKIFYSEYLLEMFPEEFYNEPLAMTQHYGKTPWEEPFFVIVDQLVDAANLIVDIFENKTRRCVSLWNPKEDWSLKKESLGGKNQVFLLAPEIKKEMKKERKPAVIICPGGGYEAVCFSGEGTPVLNYMEAAGYRAFILKYRVAPCKYPEPQEDLTLAIQYLRCHGEEYGINPQDIMVLGASAGGHLCGSQAALYKELEGVTPEPYNQFSGRPNQVGLCYPVISFVHEPHEGSFQNLCGGDEKYRKALSVEGLVDESYPPTFVWTCRDDDCVPPSNAEIMGEALTKAGVIHQLHMYPQGGHGCGLAFSKSAYTWSRSLVEFRKKISSDIPQG